MGGESERKEKKGVRESNSWKTAVDVQIVK